MIIFPIFYFPPISYFVWLNKYQDITFEKYENFQKQTYRNRCYIESANGRLGLQIPVQHNGVRLYKDIQIFNEVEWQKNHWRSIKTAYQQSSYFEYYEDELINLFQLKEKYLLDLNLKIFEKILSFLKMNIPISETTHYQDIHSINDYRNYFSAKENLLSEHRKKEFNQEPYFQVFNDRLPFQKDLSILDLICNMGTESPAYLRNNIPNLHCHLENH